ncbi:unnamed protein product [Vicia faba]|uniref:Uncharacterized protein n=1 Tax=Vicia faba TaxID=3906 RepID=A0AAV1AQA4_VICFA|nr:unnamed protein product [Vicia faba]
MATSSRFFSFHAPFTTRRNSLIIVSSKTAQRKNYLRPKILKILTKPSLPIPSTLPQPILSPPQEHEPSVDVPANEIHGEDVTAAVEETVELEELRVSVDSAKDNGVFRNISGKDIFKYGGMYLIGAFVFQTVMYFWKLENQRSKLNDLEVSEKEKSNGKIVEDQNVEKKIEEIRVMAREARRIELEKKGKEEEDGDGDSEIDHESVVSSGKLGIEKEVVERLLKLKSKINSNKDSLSALRLNGSGNSVKGGGVNVDKGKEGFVFKKKSKFKSPLTKDVKTPKGFSGTRDSRVSDVKPQDDGSQAIDNAEKLDGDKQLDQQDVTHKNKNASGVPLEERGKSDDDKSREIENDGKNVEEKMETPSMKTKDGFKTKSIGNGGLPKNSVGMSSPEVRESRTQNSQGFEKDNVHSINGSSGHGFAIKNSARKQANTRTDMWWLNLRYVLVILMQRDSNAESPKGLYSLNFTSKQWEQGDDSYTVAFEDQADANNFCFILESFFEDLGDGFRANVVPMSIQELNEEIISQGKKVLVVKKRQLQLYAGQLLTDVEMALCSIIEQDQNVP